MSQVSVNQLDSEARKRLYGKTSTFRDWCNEILRLKIGDARRHQPALNNMQIASKLGVSRQWIIELTKLAIISKLAEPDPNNPSKIKLPEKTKNASDFSRYEKDDLMKDPLISEWVLDMQTRHQGKPIKAWKNQYNSIKRLCNNLKIKPEQLIIDHKTTEKIITNFSKMLQDGTLEDTKHSSSKITDIPQSTVHVIVMAVRDFCGFHHLTWRRGVGGIMSGKVIGHAQYADIKLTDLELQKAEDYIRKEWGEDSDIMRIFTFGIETCSRQQAILTAKLDYNEIPNPTTKKPTFVMKVFEEKTQHIKNGIWKKWINRSLTQRVIKKQVDRNQEHLWTDNGRSVKKIKDELLAQLKEIYTYLGKDKIHSGYFLRRPFHAMRHIGAQRLLKLVKFNYSIVCVLGGWHTEKELKDSYGEMPEEIVLEEVHKLAGKVND